MDVSYEGLKVEKKKKHKYMEAPKCTGKSCIKTYSQESK